MPYGLYVSAEGAKAQSRRMEVISHNLANANTIGFKQDVARLQARHAEAIQRGQDSAGSQSINDIGGGVQVRDTITNFAAGNYERTGRPLDMAINGDGFFLVRKGNEEFLTRAGNFQFDAQGRLTTESGDDVLGRDGAPITINPQRPYEVTANGAIWQDGEARDVGVVNPQSLADLARVGGNLFRPLAGTQQVPLSEGRVQSGTLERSGVKSIQVLTDMISASRAFEANMHVIQNQDHVLGSLIGRVLGGGRG